MNQKASTPPSSAKLPDPEITPASDLVGFFGDPDLARSVSEDAVLKFIVSTWRQLLVAVLAGVAIFYAVTVFRETRTRDIEAAGDAFYSMQRKYDEYRTANRTLGELRRQPNASSDEKVKKEIAEQETKVDEARRKVSDALTALGDTRAPYNQIVGVYRGLLAHDVGDHKALSGALDPNRWVSVTDRGSSQRLVAELEALTYARALLDSESGVQEGRGLLKRLASDGAFAHVTAGLAIAATAQTPEERSEALALLESIETAHPEQSPLLEDEITRLKAS